MPFNQFGFEEVDFARHFEQFAEPFLVEGNMENNAYFLHEAQQSHVDSINNAISELLGDALSLLAAIDFTDQAGHVFRFGVMRRLRMIDSAFKTFQSIVPPSRTVPLSQQESDQACRDLNAIYINILGLLDNYAWTAVHQLASPRTQAENPLAIGLFKPAFVADAALQALADIVRPFGDWEKEVKTRRNPAAHRMPLYVPPAALTPEDIVEDGRLEGLIAQAFDNRDFAKVEALRESQRRVGILIPRFLHDPEGPVLDIYPTVPQDIGQAVRVGRLVQEFLRERAAS